MISNFPFYTVVSSVDLSGSFWAVYSPFSKLELQLYTVVKRDIGLVDHDNSHYGPPSWMRVYAVLKW